MRHCRQRVCCGWTGACWGTRLRGATFTRSLGTSGDNKFLWTLNGGGFAATASTYNVNIGGGGTLTWGNSESDIGSKILGTLKFGSSDSRCNSNVVFQNPINLNGADRTIFVDDNPGSVYNQYNWYDHAEMTGAISNGTGTAGLVKTGPGELELQGENTYNGTTTVLGGTLSYSAASAMSGGAHMLSGGTLNTAALSKTIGAFQINGGTVTGTGTLTSTAAYDLQSGTVDVNLGGSVGLNKATSGSVSFTRSLPAGNYSISDGTLNLNGLTKTIGTFRITGGTVTGTSSLTSTAAYDLQNGTVDVALGGSVGLNKTTSGSVLLTKTLPSGNYSISDGMLNINSQSKSISSFLISGGTISGAGSLTASSTYSVQGGVVDVILAGSLRTLTKSGTGTATLSRANTYTGQTNVNAGKLQIRHVNALGTTAGKTVVASGAVLSVGGGLTGTINEPIDLNGSGDGNGALQSLDAGTDVTFAGPINLVSNAGIGGTSHIAISGNVTGAGGLSKYGSNRVNLNGNNSYVGRTTVASGTLELGSAAQNAVFTLGGADIQFGQDGVRLQRHDQPGGDDPELADRELPRRTLGRGAVQEFDGLGQRADARLVRQRIERGDGDGDLRRRLQPGWERGSRRPECLEGKHRNRGPWNEVAIGRRQLRRPSRRSRFGYVEIAPWHERECRLRFRQF